MTSPASNPRDDSSAETQRFFRATLDSLTSHIAILDERGIILDVNEAWRRFADANGFCAADHAVGANYLRACEAEDGDEAARGIRRVLAGDLPLFTLQYPCHSPDEKRWFLMRVTRFASPGPVRVVVEHQNITAEKIATERLEALRFSIDTSGDAMYWLRPDENFRVAFANAAAVRHFGYTEEELLRTTVPDWAPSFTLERCEELWKRLRNEGTIVFECVHRRADGALVPVEVSSNYFSFGGVEYITGSFRDISERKRADEALRRSEADFRTLTNTLPAIVWIARHDGHVEYYNHRWYELTGASDAHRGGDTSWLPFVHPDDRAASLDAWYGCVRAGTPMQLELRLSDQATGEYRWHLSRALPVRGDDGHVARWFGTAIDIEDQKRTEAALRDSQTALREADRRKDEFLAVLGHELRNPLAPIGNAVQILRLKGPPDPILVEARDLIDRQVAQMTRLVDDLLEVSRITRGTIALELAPVDIAEVVARAVETSRPLIESRRHELSVHMPERAVLVRGDALRLSQVVANLLNNAAKYTEVGGRIDVRAERDHDSAVLSVADSGVGIAPAMLSRVFDMFAQAEVSLHRAQGGLGIGLTLARRLVELHGGTVEVHSDGPGRGSRFVVRLPAMDDAASERIDRREAKPPLPTAPCRVLVVDDNTDSAASLAMVLELWGHEVELAHDGITALEAARRSRPQVVLLDLGLPKLDGFQVAERLRQDPALSNVLLVAMTGYGQDEDRRSTREAGFDLHLIKPINLDALRDLLVGHTRRPGADDVTAARGD